MRRHLVIFARAPRLGTVKRRLARELGALTAWRFHHLTTGRLIRRLEADPRWMLWVAITPDRWVRWRGGLWPGRYRLLAQGGGDLGERMGRVFARLPPGPVVIIGSDIPDIAAHHVAAAFAALGQHDAVLGPAADGGYWLIGLKRRPRLLLPFAGVRWGGAHALEDTQANLAGRSLSLLEGLQDVDTATDFHAWLSRPRSLRATAA